MNRPKKAFIERWKRRLAGGFLFGTTATHQDGPLARAQHVFEITAEVEEFLGQLWDDDEAAKPSPAPGAGPGAVGNSPPPAEGEKRGEGQGQQRRDDTGNGNGNGTAQPGKRAK